MPEAALKDYLQPFPGIRSFIFAPPPEGESRTWIFRAIEDPQLVLEFHFTTLLTQGWNVVENASTLVAKRGTSDLSVSALRRQDETRIVYEVHDR